MGARTWRKLLNPLSVAVLAMGGTLAILGYRDWVAPNVFPTRCVQVVPGQIYRSGELTPAALTKVVRERGIRTIVDLGAWELESRANRRERRTALALGIQRARVRNHTGDQLGEVNSYAQALRFMSAPARRPVLVHCGAHTERAACVIALYRMLREGWTLEEACAEADALTAGAGHDPRLRSFLATWSEPLRAALASGEPVKQPAPGAAQPSAANDKDRTDE